MKVIFAFIADLMSYSSTVRRYLSAWISELLSAVPLRSQATFVELLCACLISPEGWVTRAILAIHSQKHWTTYFKLIERGSIKPLRLARAMLRLIGSVFVAPVVTLIIDDSLSLRHSKRAPGSQIQFDHARKTNRPAFVLAQGWVTLAVSVLGGSGRNWALAVLSRLVRTTGNRSKLALAWRMIRSLLPLLADQKVRVLMDAWYMRAPLLLRMLRNSIQAIGQVRHDTALYRLPTPVSGKRRGRPRKYGAKLTSEEVDSLPAREVLLFAYSKEQRVRLRSCIALARFLKARPVHAVWVEFFDDKKKGWSRSRLILATETELSAEDIVRIYARRWGIEPLFHNLKRWWGINNLWQQSVPRLESWMAVRCCAWNLVQMLALVVEKQFPITALAPWRKGDPLTAGLVAQWLRVQYPGVSFRSALDRKSRKFTFPEPKHNDRLNL
jgi:hypothetical protein